MLHFDIADTQMKRTILLLFLFFGSLSFIYAQEVSTPGAGQPSNSQDASKARANENYYADPFSDLAELENQSDEEQEESIDRFYAYGRIFHIEVYGDAAILYGPMSDLYHGAWLMGGRVSYFLDWDLAVTFHIGLGKASMSFANPDPLTSPVVPTFTGSAILFNMGLGIKYYINFHDISRAIAYVNPAIHLGGEMSIINDSLNMDDIPPSINITDPSHKMIAPGLFFGMSLEMPIFRKSLLLGTEFIYHLSFFPTWNSKVAADDPNFGSIQYNGTYITVGAKITINL